MRWATLSSRVSRDALLLALVLVASGCGGRHAKVQVKPSSSLADAPIEMQASGFPKRAQVSVVLTSADAALTTWAARVNLTTDDHGGVRVPMIAFTHMLPTTSTLATEYKWNGASPLRFRLSVTRGDVAATTSFDRRLLGAPVATKHLAVAADGLEGTFFAPSGAHRHPAILLFGGSEGGLSAYVTRIGLVLAGHGYPVLSVAYFAAPGLPQELSNVPLAYFARGLRWLAAQPEVDGRRLVAFGISRGSEAAQLVGAYYPTLVHAVVASVPGNLVGHCWGGKCTGSAWSFHAKPLPQFEPIPVERIAGPMLALCATKDTIWPSCPQAKAIMARRRAHYLGANDMLLVANGAGHFVSASIAYWIYAPNLNNTEADADAREAARTWPELLRFLARATA
ncbi:MAG: alpha/beta hydrolase family protein [Gaiellaceae bacterium]